MPDAQRFVVKSGYGSFVWVDGGVLGQRGLAPRTETNVDLCFAVLYVVQTGSDLRFLISKVRLCVSCPDDLVWADAVATLVVSSL